MFYIYYHLMLISNILTHNDRILSPCVSNGTITTGIFSSKIDIMLHFVEKKRKTLETKQTK
jgi:hypothetical protein